MIYIALAVYTLATLFLGWVARRMEEQKTPEDYFLANRGLGSLLLFFTMIATNFSAFFFLGFAGAGYRIGLSYYAMMAYGTALSAFSIYFVGYQVWKQGKFYGCITPAELIGKKLRSKGLALLYMTVMVVFTLPYIAIQPIGAGYLLEELTSGQIPYIWGATFLTVVMVAYVWMGGMRSVALTDTFQGVLMFVLTFVALFAIASSLGGFEQANRKVYDIAPDLFVRSGRNQYFTIPVWVSYMILWIVSIPMFPQIFMRYYTAKSVYGLQVTALLYPIVTAILFVCPVIIGMWGHLEFPGLEGKATDRILPIMLTVYTPEWLPPLVMLGAFAAFMSTMDSQLLALSSMITRDLYTDMLNPDLSLNKQTVLGKILVVILSCIGLFLAIDPPSTIFTIATNAFTGLSVLFPTTIVALYFPDRFHSLSCILSITAGELLLLVLLLEFLPRNFFFGFTEIIPVLLVAIGTLIGTNTILRIAKRN